MPRSITKEISTKKEYRFEEALMPGAVNVFVIGCSGFGSETYLGWVTETNSAHWIEPEVVEFARKFLRKGL